MRRATLTLTFILSVMTGAVAATDLTIHHLDVGTGDATLLIPPESKAILVDVAQDVKVSIVRVIDGDTIMVCCIEGKDAKVRYIGVNTPETNHPSKGVESYGQEAKEANRKLVEGKAVRLEFDVERQDRYGRLLGYVFLEDGTL